jgi:hypothetical protein
MGKKRKYQRQRGVTLDREAVDRASEQDRLWFDAHPEATVYLRPEIPGEFPNGASQTVLVTQIRPGIRQRERVPDGTNLLDAVVASQGDPLTQQITRVVRGTTGGDERNN